MLVAPLVGAWIEIDVLELNLAVADVAPLVGAWIEIITPFKISSAMPVAPLVGAWIEMSYYQPLRPEVLRRSSCRSVD